MRKHQRAVEASSLLIQGGRVIDPVAGIDDKVDILLRDGQVAEVNPGKKERGQADETINARGLIVAPGFIDLHVHLREPGQSYKETIASGTAAAAQGGFTSVCAMPNTVPVNDSPDLTRWMCDPSRAAVVNVFPVAAATCGSRGVQLTDFNALRQAGAIAVSDDGRPILSESLMQQALRQAATVNFPVIQHAEDTSLTAGCSMNAGPTAFRLGLNGMPNAAESAIVERDIELAQTTGGHYHVAHLSTAEALEAVRRGKRRHINVSCEVTPHHFTLLDSDVAEYDTRFKMNPPLRSRADREALQAGLADGTADAIATDHAPHALHEKQVEFERAAFGIIGLETALPLALTRLHKERNLPLPRIVELFSAGPARIIGLKSRGSLQPGYIADVTLFDPHKRWKYDVSRSASAARNSPFDGWQLTGKVVATVVGGRIVYHGD
jgi:dihydroorotase